jgi:putative nucleotidyltransferase with HDIG domain
LAEFTGSVSSDIAYTAGLLHDIGKVVLDQYIASAFPLFYRRTLMDGVDMLAVEREEFGITHTEIGSRLAEHWSLAESLKDTIMHHHYPERATVDHELTHVVYLADLLMSRFLVKHELERMNTDELVLRLGKIGLAPEQFSVIIDSIPRQILNG